MSRRAWMLGGPVAVLVVAALGFFYVTSTPRYALYSIGTAMQRHDVAAAERYFDVERIADAAADVIVADYLARQPAPTSAAEENGRQLVASIVKRRVRPQVITRVRQEIRRSVERAGVHATSLVLPIGALAVLRGFEVSSAGPDVWVTYRDPGQGPVRFRMSRQAGYGWQISEFDPEWVRRRVHEEPSRIR